MLLNKDLVPSGMFQTDEKLFGFSYPAYPPIRETIQLIFGVSSQRRTACEENKLEKSPGGVRLSYAN
jgi:hypothetical protein